MGSPDDRPPGSAPATYEQYLALIHEDDRSVDYPFLPKPLHAAGLARRVRELLDG